MGFHSKLRPDGGGLHRADHVGAATEQELVVAVACEQRDAGLELRHEIGEIGELGMVRGAAHCIRGIQMKPGDRYFSASPFYHAGGSVGAMLAPRAS